VTVLRRSSSVAGLRYAPGLHLRDHSQGVPLRDRRQRFKTVRALEKFLATLPAGTTVRWRQGCERFDGQPLSSERELEDFRRFCKAHRLSLEIELSA